MKPKFSECVLHGRTPAVTARLRLSYARLFNSGVLGRVAAEYNLSPREAQMLTLMLKGVPLNRTGEAMGISVGTAKIHRRNVYRKMKACCAEQVVMLAVFASGLLLTEADSDLIESCPSADEVAYERLKNEQPIS